MGKVSERFPGSWKVAFALVEVKGPGGCRVRFGDSTGRSEDMSEIEQGIGVVTGQVGLRGKGDGRACEFLCFAMLATVGEDPGRQSLAEGLGGHVLARSGFLAYRDQAGGFVVPALTLSGDGSGQLGCGDG